MTDQSRTNPGQANKSRPFQHLVRGSLGLMLGAWTGMWNVRAVFYALRAQYFAPWFMADTVLRIAAAVFFIWIGARSIRRAGEEVPRPRIGWGRLLLGVVFIYVQIKGHFAPAPNVLQPDNAGERVGMQAVSAIIWIVGVALILAAFSKKPPQPKTLPERPAPSPGPKNV